MKYLPKISAKYETDFADDILSLECNESQLENDELKIDGNLAVCWSSNLEFTVERSTKTLVGSAVSGEGLVNVYRGTGRVLMCPVAPTTSLFESTNTMAAKAALNPAIHLENKRKTHSHVNNKRRYRIIKSPVSALFHL